MRTSIVKPYSERSLFVACTYVFAALAAVGLPQKNEFGPGWNQWRGPGRDGRLVGFRAPSEWPVSLKKHWVAEVGIGHSSPVIVGDYVYVFARQGEEEIVRAFDLAGGNEKWKRGYPAPYEMNPAARGHGKGPKATPLVTGGRIYTLGISGILSCLNAGNGRVIWRKDFTSRFKTTSPLFGASASPLIDRGSLYIHVGGHDDGALLALDPANGNEKWKWTGDGPSYASPIIVTVDGIRQLVTQTQNLCAGFDSASGKLLWSIPFKTPYDQNIITPLVTGDKIVFAGINQPTFAVRLKRNGRAWTAQRVWESRDSIMYMSSPVTDGKRIYGMSNRRGGQLFILDAATGKTVWLGEGRTGDNAAIVDAGRDLLVETTGADLLVLRKRPDKMEEIRRYHLAESPTWATPAVHGSVIAIKDESKLTLWEIPKTNSVGR